MQHTIIETVINASALLKECKLDIEKISQEETILQLNKTDRLTYSPFRLQPKAIRKLFIDNCLLLIAIFDLSPYNLLPLRFSVMMGF